MIHHRDGIDIVLRFIGLIAIAVPIFLFYFQQSAEREKQKALLQVNLFSEVSIKIHSLLDADTINKSYVDLSNSLFYDNFLRTSFLINDSIKKKLKDIIFDITALSNAVNIINQYDSLFGRMTNDFPNFRSRTAKSSDEIFAKWKEKLDKINRDRKDFIDRQIVRFYSSNEINDSSKHIFNNEKKYYDGCVHGLNDIAKYTEGYIESVRKFHKAYQTLSWDKLEDFIINTEHLYMDIENELIFSDEFCNNYRKYIKGSMEDLDRNFYEIINQYFKANSIN